MKIRRILIGSLIAMMIVPTIIIALFAMEFDPSRYAPALKTAVEKATGRELTFGGPIKISLSLNPEISTDDVSLANPPGFADRSLVTIRRIRPRISLLPLFKNQINIERLVLLEPQLVLETTDTGAADWDLTPPSGPELPAGRIVTSSGRHQPGYRFALEAVEIQNGSITIRPAHNANSITIAIARFIGTAASASSLLSLNAQGTSYGIPVALVGSVGPIARFSGYGSGPWPVDLKISSRGAMGTVDGSVTEPRTLSGYDLYIKLAVPALESLADALPSELLNKVELPPIHGITGAAEIVDQGSPVPEVKHASVKLGASNLSAVWPGLTLAALDVEAPSLTGPVSINGNGAIGTMPIVLAGTIGAASLLINPALLPHAANPGPTNFPVSVAVQVGANKLDVDGGIATPAKLAGAALNVQISIPDLPSLNSAAGVALPRWKNIIAQGTLIDPGGLGLENSIGIDSLILKMDDAALGGDLSWYFGNRPRLQLALTAQENNLDALLAALASAPVPITPAPKPPSAPQQTNYILPPLKLPSALLRRASADIQISANSLTFHHSTYSAIQAHAVLANGVLNISPLTALIPGGSIAANVTVDASKDPAKTTVSAAAPALALSPFLSALGLPSAAQGTMQAGLSASGLGNNLQELAASVQGQFGVAMVNGVVDGDVLNSLFGAALAAVGLPTGLGGTQGPVAVRCFGLRLDAENGVGQISALTLDSSRLLVQGGGTLNFGDETLGLIIRPQLRMGESEVGVPIKIGGTFAQPTMSVASLAAVQEAAKAAAGLTMPFAQAVPGGISLLGKIEAALGPADTGDICPAALTLARLGKPGPAAPPESVAASGGANGQTPSSGPKSLLNALLGK